jgi:hypothetical protein
VIEVAGLALVTEQAARLRELMKVLPIRDVTQVGFVVYVTFERRRDGKTYVLRFRCDGFPITPASVHFVDAKTREDDGTHVWPADGEQAIKRGSNPRFICLPGTREYHQAHGAPQPGVHELGLPVLFHHILAAIEARG